MVREKVVSKRVIVLFVPLTSRKFAEDTYKKHRERG
jgi:hypothetical protein